MFWTKRKQFEIFKVSSKQLQTSQIHFIIFESLPVYWRNPYKHGWQRVQPTRDQTANF